MRYTTTLLILFTATVTNAQRTEVGVKMTNELTFYTGYAPGFGGQVVFHTGKHGGIESGVYYQARTQEISIVYKIGANTFVYDASIRESRLQLPILYRYNAKALNFVLGPVVDYFMGWKEKSHDPNVSVNTYKRHSINISLTTGVSKSFHITKDIIVEPEARATYIITDSDGGVSLNLAVRKIL